MRIPELKSKVPAVVVVSLLLVVWNPELRAFLLLFQAMGAELLLAFFLIQLRSYLPIALACVAPCTRHCIDVLRGLGRFLGWLAAGLMPWPSQLLAVNIPALRLVESVGANERKRDRG